MSKSTTNISDISVQTIDGQTKSLGDYAGNVLLLVNVASYCGYTPQYRDLQQLYQEYGDRGLKVLAFPCNDFGAQEPGTNEEIQTFCDSTYGVTFELFDKLHAKGPEQHPLYARLTKGVDPKGDVAWNFEKFLVGKRGEVVARYMSSVKPTQSNVITAIERELSA